MYQELRWVTGQRPQSLDQDLVNLCYGSGPIDWMQLFWRAADCSSLRSPKFRPLKATNSEHSAGRSTGIYQHLCCNKTVFLSHCFWEKKPDNHFLALWGWLKTWRFYNDSENTTNVIAGWIWRCYLPIKTCTILYFLLLLPSIGQHQFTTSWSRYWEIFSFPFLSQWLTAYEEVCFPVKFTFSLVSCFSHSRLHRK